MVVLPESLSVEMNSHNQEKKAGFLARKWDWVKAKVVEIAKMTKKIGKDDPRRIIHSMKVGLALTLVSLFYYFRPLYDGFGEAGMWAIITVVVVFEFTVGGTLSKSLNRGCATLLAAALGVGAEYLAALGGEKGGRVVLGFLVFTLATASTFTRFFPNVRSRYDYGVMIFILTFCLVAVSGFRVSHIILLAHQRLSTILIGGATCIMISIFVCPVWAGQDLHNLVAENIEKLAAFLDGFGGEFFSFPGDGGKFAHKEHDKPFLLGYKSVLESKATEESLANFAWWEPHYGCFRFRQPWEQYLKIGILTRECASQIEALGEHINSKPEVASEFHRKIQKPCTTMSTESGKALKELSSTIKNMRFPSPAVETYIQNSKAAADDLKTILQKSSLPNHDLQEIMQLFLVASTLINIIKCVEKISVSVNELSQKARFKKPNSTTTCDKQRQLLHQGTIEARDDIAEGKDRVMIVIHGPSSDSPENKNPIEREQELRL